VIIQLSMVKGCDSNFEVKCFQILKVATNETTTSTLYETICTRTALENYYMYNNDQQFNSLII